VVPIDDCRSGPDPAVMFIRPGCDWELGPMNQIGTDCVAPGHHGRLCERVRTMLEKQMKLAVEIDQPVWIVHPALLGREMKLRAVPLVIERTRRDIALVTPGY